MSNLAMLHPQHAELGEIPRFKAGLTTVVVVKPFLTLIERALSGAVHGYVFLAVLARNHGVLLCWWWYTGWVAEIQLPVFGHWLPPFLHSCANARRTLSLAGRLINRFSFLRRRTDLIGFALGFIYASLFYWGCNRAFRSYAGR